MHARLKEMLIKEFLQLFRDPRMRLMILVVPLIQMLVIAFAMTSDVTDVSIAVLDNDQSPASRDLLAAFTASGYFDIAKRLDRAGDIDRVLDAGEVQAVLYIPSTFSDRLADGRPAPVQFLADGTQSQSASIVFGYAEQIVGSFNQRWLENRLNRTLGRDQQPARIEVLTRAWFNVNLESKYYYVPGLIAMMILVNSMMLSSIAIVREKEIGTIEQIMVTPLSRMEFIIGKTLPYAAISYATMTVMFVLAWLFFDIHNQGSWPLLYGLAGIFMAGNLGLALFISANAGTQQQALLSAFFIMMPAVLLSGFMFPVDNMPTMVQYASYLNPMRWFLDILRAVVLKGEGLSVIWPQAAWLTGLALSFLTVAALGFRKTLG